MRLLSPLLLLLAVVQCLEAADFDDLPTEEAALLNAIIAHPDEDTPRLIYADWLDEHDDPLRAEFIRLQVRLHRMTPKDTDFGILRTREEELARMPKAVRIPKEYANRRKPLMDLLLPLNPTGDHARYVTQIRQQPLENTPWLMYADFLDEHFNQELGQALRLAVNSDHLYFSSHRGFIDTIACSSSTFANFGKTLLEESPFLRDLTVVGDDLTPGAAPTVQILTQSKRTENLRSLNLSIPVTPSQINALTPHLKRLERLDLHEPSMATLRAVLRGALGTQLTTLHVSLGVLNEADSNELREELARFAKREHRLQAVNPTLHALLPPTLQATIGILPPEDYGSCHNLLSLLTDL